MNNLPFLRILVIVNGGVPLAMLAWDAVRGQLGANAVNNALHTTGILALIFLFLALAMTPLRQVTGWGGWVAFRRPLGLYGFCYSLVHLLIYVGLDRAMNLASTVHEIATRRFLQVGAVALVLMIPLAVTSTHAMMRRLGARRWKLLHRSAYLVAILGVLHYYLLVKSDVRQPLAFAGVLVGLLGARLGWRFFQRRRTAVAARRGTSPIAPGDGPWRPPASEVPASEVPAAEVPAAEFPSSGATSQPWKGELQVAAIRQETPDVKTFCLTAVDDSKLPFGYLPGQFLTLQLTIDEKPVKRSYTLASSPSRTEACELSIKREPRGLVSRHLHDTLRVGQRLTVTAPAGRFTFTGDGASAVLLIAGGVGITPLMSITRYLADRAWPGQIHFVIVARTERDLIFRDELRELGQRFPQLHVRQTLTRSAAGDGWTGERGRLSAQLLKRCVPDLADVPVYLCGPRPMMDAARELLIGMGVPEARIHTETFGSRSSPATRSARSIRFARTNVEITGSSDQTILDAAEQASVALPYECRTGVCGQCKTRLLAGRVRMDCEDALTRAEKDAGFVLACQARPLSPLAVDA